MSDDLLYKALRSEEWEPSVRTGATQAAVDRVDGFVHLSTRTQIEETLARHFAGARDVRLLGFHQSDLADHLKWEPSRGGALFPHYYGVLKLDWAIQTWILAIGTSGTPLLPEDF